MAIDIPRPVPGDAIAGVSVAMVLVPQSMAYAALAGLPPVVGLFAAALPLLVFSIGASSPFLQTGPTAVTALLTNGVLTATGAEVETAEFVAMAALLAFTVGAIRIVVGALRAGRLVYLMPEPVMFGFTSGAAVLIICSQLPKALGIADNEGHIVRRAASALGDPSEWSVTAIALALITVALMVGGKAISPLVPSVLIAVVGGLIFSHLTEYDGPVVGTIPEGFPELSLGLEWGSFSTIIIGAVVISLLGFAEPSAIARTYANEDNDDWDANREFVSSGLANLASAASGGMPVGGSFSRSSINRFAGARTRVSGGITGLVVLCFLPFANILERLPTAVLGAIVIGAVVKLLRFKGLAAIASRDRWQAGLAYVTMVAAIVLSPRLDYAVIIGVVLGIAHHFLRPLRVDQLVDGGEARARPNGMLWLGSATAFAERLQAFAAQPDTDRFVVDFGATPFVDGTTAEAVAAAARQLHDRGCRLEIDNAPAAAMSMLDAAVAQPSSEHS